MKETRLINIHKELNASLVNFAGYLMPVHYNSALQEHIQVRNKVGIFDVSHMGQIMVTGEGAHVFLQKLCTNNLDKLDSGKAQYTLLLNDSGGIIDDLIIYKLDAKEYMLVVNASNIEKDFNWLLENSIENVKIENISDEISLIALQGPLAIDVLSEIASIDVSKIPYYSFKKASIKDIQDVLISATGYTGAGGFELYVKNKDVEKLWRLIYDIGQKYGISPAGLAARDSLRLEKAYCLYGNEINDSIDPLTAKLKWVLDFGKDFIGKDSLLKIKSLGIAKNIVGLSSLEKAIPRKGEAIVCEKDNIVGEVTSGCFSPILKKPIAMAYINKANIDSKEKLFVKSRGRKVEIKIEKLPFV